MCVRYRLSPDEKRRQRRRRAPVWASPVRAQTTRELVRLLHVKPAANRIYLSKTNLICNLSFLIMELHQLRYFLAVADEGSFTAAASAVRISQSGVSTQIQKLERELGVTLLDRSSRKATLTGAGECLLPHARRVVSAVTALADAADDLRGLVVGSLRLGIISGLAWRPLFDALAATHAEHPGVDIELREGSADDLIAQVRTGVIDVAVATWASGEPDGVDSWVGYEDVLVAVVRDDHAWAGRAEVTVAELVEVDLISFSRGTGSRAALDTVLTPAGGKLVPRWEVATPALVEILTTGGLGVGIMPKSLVEVWGGVAYVPIAGVTAVVRQGVVWQRRPSPAARALLSRLLPLADGVDSGYAAWIATSGRRGADSTAFTTENHTFGAVEYPRQDRRT